MQNLKIAISGYGSISPLGVNKEQIWEHYLDTNHCFGRNGSGEWVAPLSAPGKKLIAELSSDKRYQQLDPCVHYAIAASRIAVQQAGWDEHEVFGINIGSSRGATTIFEKYHREFIESGSQKTNPFTSPSTTLGNISSWVSTDFSSSGPEISLSATCSTALQSVANAVAWLKGGLVKRFLAGGSEAPLTPFTISQMKALKIYSTQDTEYPCRSMDLSKGYNSMILGEGAACFCLELSSEKAIAHITGLGYGTETIKHGASLSADAACLKNAMQIALEGHDLQSVDVVLLHSPGTILGDQSERQAINDIFGENTPLLTSNKWKIGHTLGASGALSMEMALLMLKHDQFIETPFILSKNRSQSIRKILINTVGFGGVAMSIVIEK